MRASGIPHEHHFDRRVTDANVAALNIRVTGLEGRMEIVEQEVRANSRELLANTALTKQVHQKAEQIELDTKSIVEATRWLSTSKSLVIAIIAGVSGSCGAIVAAVHALKALGLI